MIALLQPPPSTASPKSNPDPDGPLIVLQKQFRPPVAKVCVEIPAGLLDPNESAAVCAVRELKEETGYEGQAVAGGAAGWRSAPHEGSSNADEAMSGVLFNGASPFCVSTRTASLTLPCRSRLHQYQPRVRARGRRPIGTGQSARGAAARARGERVHSDIHSPVGEAVGRVPAARGRRLRHRWSRGSAGGRHRASTSLQASLMLAPGNEDVRALQMVV